MKLLGKRSIAILITVVVVIASTLLGVYNTSGRYARQIEKMFYDGVFLSDQGFTQPGINTHLENGANAALGLATLLEKHPELSKSTETLLSARRELMSADGVAQKEQAANKMRDGFIDLLDAARDADLSERDKDAATQFYSVFNGALIAISNSRYNDVVGDHLNSQCALMHLAGNFVSAKQPHSFYAEPFDSSVFAW